MLGDLLVVVGMQAILLVSVAVLTLYNRRMDVVSGRFFKNKGDRVRTGSDPEHLKRENRAPREGGPVFLPVREAKLALRPGAAHGLGWWALGRSHLRRLAASRLAPPAAQARAPQLPQPPSKAGALTYGPLGSAHQDQPSLPDGIRIYAIGDVHGRSDLLQRVLTDIDADCKLRPARRPIIVFVGDYIDRGPYSRNVLDLLVEWQRFHEAIFLRGNHETFLPRFLADPRTLDDWRQYGGLETLLSYGLRPSINPDLNEQIVLAKEFAEAVPQEHLDFLQTLELTFSCGDFLFVHAGVRPGIPLRDQTEDDLLWIRDDFLSWQQPFECFVVHGHTPVDEPDLRLNRINIDTGAYATGRLTCVVIENSAITRLAGDELIATFSVPSTRAAPDPAGV